MSMNDNLDKIKAVENELNLKTDDEKLLFANYMIGFLSCSVDDETLKTALWGSKVFMAAKRKEDEKFADLLKKND